MKRIDETEYDPWPGDEDREDDEERASYLLRGRYGEEQVLFSNGLKDTHILAYDRKTKPVKGHKKNLPSNTYASERAVEEAKKNDESLETTTLPDGSIRHIQTWVRNYVRTVRS